jgi:integrase
LFDQLPKQIPLRKEDPIMKGHLRERSPNHWAIVLEIRDHETGKRKRKWHSFVGSKRAAETECARLISELTGGAYIEPARTTLAAFLERWLEHVKTQVSPRTHERYTELARKNIAPLLGTTVMSKLRPVAISAAYAKALTGGHRKRPRGLSPRTVGHMHRILRQALQQAVRWQILVRNPADMVKPPRVERGKSPTLTAEQAAQLLVALAHSRVYWPTLIALATGMRRGEISALRWQHVDLDRGIVEVVETIEETKTALRFKPPKNGKTRAITLPAFAIAELRRLKRAQAEELLRIGIRQTGLTLVCGRADGEVHKPLALTYEFARFVRQLKDLPQVRFHDLRHSHATQLLASGVHPKVAQERLGHSSISITLDLYSHTVESLQDEAASRVDAALGRALDIQREKKG